MTQAHARTCVGIALVLALAPCAALAQEAAAPVQPVDPSDAEYRRLVAQAIVEYDAASFDEALAPVLQIHAGDDDAASARGRVNRLAFAKIQRYVVDPAAAEAVEQQVTGQDVVLVEDGTAPALEGRVATSRRLAGTRIADLDIGKPGAPHHVEIEVPLEATAATGTTVRFRPTRWKTFAQ